jgi:tetratricopeptide (TPR) repeat protein
MRRFFLVIIGFLMVGSVQATAYFDLSPAVRSAYQQMISLRFKAAKSEIAALRRNEPDNMMGVYLENYLECASLLIEDNQSGYKSLKKNKDKRLSLMADADRNSPYFLYCQGEIRLQWAVLHGRYQSFLACVTDVKQGYALLEENQRRFPDFMANLKSLGMLHAVVGNVPDELRWAVKGFGGMKGSVAQGVAEMEQVLQYARANPDFLFGVESYVAYAYLQLHLNNNSEKAWKTMQEGINLQQNNPLAMFAMANVAMRTGHNDEAVRWLERMPSGGQYHPFPYKNFLLGIAKLYRLDGDANQPLYAFLKEYKGSFGIKEAYQKLAWYYVLIGDTPSYWSHIYQAKIQGITRADTDKAADREANSGEMPDQLLLKGRLLFDGGYYQRAYETLQGKGEQYNGHKKHQLEYAYRMGRILHKLGRQAEAIAQYNNAIAQGSSEPWYFACNAAYQLGTLYEDRKEWVRARTAYQKCLKIKPDEYATSLHAKAKVGLNRIKGKG